ncbi:MAG: hypothetical protein ACLVEC_04695, partial [Romboutsia timonensis]
FLVFKLYSKGVLDMKVWKDANEVIKMVHELPSNKLRKTEREMIAIPKFDKNIDKKEGKPRIK